MNYLAHFYLSDQTSDEYPMPDIVWVFDGKKVSFFQLNSDKYHQISNSNALTLLSSEKLSEFLILSETKGQTFALKSFRQALNELK